MSDFRNILGSDLSRRVFIPLALFLVCFTLGFVWLLKYEPLPFSDFRAYLYNAFSLKFYHQYGHPEPTTYRLPGYPFFLFLVLQFGDSMRWLSLWNIILTALTPVLIYFLARQLFPDNKKTALAAGLVCALDPTFFFFSTVCASEHLFVPLLLSSLLLVRLSSIKPVLRMMLAGAALGLAVLTRGEGLFYLPVIILYILLSSRSRRRGRVLSAGFLAACLLVLLPWYVRNIQLFGSGAGLSTSSGVNFYLAHNADRYGHISDPGTLLQGTPLEGKDETTMCRLGYELGWDYLRENPLRLFKDVARGTRLLYMQRDNYSLRSSLYVPARYAENKQAFRKKYPAGSCGLVNVYFYSLSLLALASLVFYRKFSRTIYLLLLGLVVMNWVCYAVVFLGQTRYSYTAEVALCVLAGMTLSELGGPAGRFVAQIRAPKNKKRRSSRKKRP